MEKLKLSAESLLAGSKVVHTIEIPPHLYESEESEVGVVEVRPLMIRDVERITRAAKEQRMLTSILTVQQALVSPAMSVEQVASLPAGLVQFLLDVINRLSGLSLNNNDLENAVKEPLTKACFILAREFGWTPAQCSELTVGQILLYLEMLASNNEGDAS